MSVKRYELEQGSGYDPYASMEESGDGDYVKHSDYQSLAAENEGLRACLERIHKAADEGSADPVLFRVQIRAQAREALSRKAAP